MSARRVSTAVACGLAALGAVSEVRAQGNPYSAPIGGRSALMGNTGIAVGVDGAAPFLNPATIVRLDDQRFSFSVNFYSYSLSRFGNWNQPGPVDGGQFGNVSLGNTSLVSSGFRVLPSTLCLFFTLAPGSPDPSPDLANLASWRQKLAICLGSTESQGYAFSAIPFNGTTSLGQTSQSQSLVESWNRVNVGPSYSVAVSRRLALGLSVHVVYTSESFILDSSSITASVKNGGVQSSLGFGGGGNSFDVSSILGAIYSAAPYTLGLSLTLPSVHALGSYSGTMHNEYGSGTTDTAVISNGSGTFSATPPVRIAVGAAAEWPRLNVEVDEAVNLPSPSGFTASVTGTQSNLSGTTLTTAPFSATYSVAQTPTFTTSIGAEYFVRKDFSLIGGFSLNLSALSPLAPTMTIGNLVQERQSQATASAGVGTYSKGGTLLLGFQLGYGWGESIAANPYVTPNDLAVIDTRAYSATFILAGSTNLKSLGRAVVKIEHVISGDPDAPGSTKDAPPAKETTSPKEKAPKEPASKETSPKEIAPKDAAPKETPAKETPPKETPPKETPPKEAAPKEPPKETKAPAAPPKEPLPPKAATPKESAPPGKAPPPIPIPTALPPPANPGAAPSLAP